MHLTKIDDMLEIAAVVAKKDRAISKEEFLSGLESLFLKSVTRKGIEIEANKILSGKNSVPDPLTKEEYLDFLRRIWNKVPKVLP